MSFKKFLKNSEKAFFASFGKNKINIGQWVYWQTCLGEWAWGEISASYYDYYKLTSKKNAPEEAYDSFYDFLLFEYGTEEALLREISEACLGKGEVSKRLKELKK